MSVTISGNGDVSGINAVFQPGDWKQSMRKSTPAGWIPASTLTIGNVGSGAAFADVSAFALFAFWWAEWSNAELPILTSAGGASTRGASALADWNALKRLSVFGTAGRFLRVPGTINGVTIVAGVQYADTLKDHTHQAPSSGGGIRKFQSGGTSAWVADGAANSATENWATLGPSTGAALETAGASIGIPGFWKL